MRHVLLSLGLVAALLLTAPRPASAAPPDRITTFADPAGLVDEPNGIVTGPDGNLWFTSTDSDRIGRLNPATGNITTYTHADLDGPQEITADVEGEVWFTSSLSDRIGSINPATGVITM